MIRPKPQGQLGTNLVDCSIQAADIEVSQNEPSRSKPYGEELSPF